jgi:hypothetical protein
MALRQARQPWRKVSQCQAKQQVRRKRQFRNIKSKVTYDLSK